MAKTLPSQRSMILMRAEGYLVGRTERWNPYAGPIRPETGKPTGIRQDLFRWIDLICIRADVPGVLGVQTTSSPNLAGHITKMVVIPEFLVWLRAGNGVEVHGWIKRPLTKARKRAKWECRRKEILLRQDEIIVRDIKEIEDDL